MLKVRAWERWQGEALYDRLRKRKPKGRDKPVTLAFIAIATNMDDPSGNFGRFAASVGGGITARGLLLAVLGYVGRDAASTGVVRCERMQLGPLVLSDRTEQVSGARGARVYDALIASGICEEIAAGDVREIVPPQRGSSPPSSGEGSPPVSPVSSPPSSGRRGEERRGENPPYPLSGGRPEGGGEGAGSAAPTDSERRGALAACGVLIGERDQARDVRARAREIEAKLRAGSCTQAELDEFLRTTVYPRTAARVAYLSARVGGEHAA